MTPTQTPVHAAAEVAPTARDEIERLAASARDAPGPSDRSSDTGPHEPPRQQAAPAVSWPGLRGA